MKLNAEYLQMLANFRKARANNGNKPREESETATADKKNG